MKKFTIIFKGDGKFRRHVLDANSQKDAVAKFMLLAEVLYFSFSIVEIFS